MPLLWGGSKGRRLQTSAGEERNPWEFSTMHMRKIESFSTRRINGSRSDRNLRPVFRLFFKVQRSDNSFSVL